MPAANPVSTEAPSRPDASARAGGTRPSESGFSGRLAQALAAPAPDAPQPQAPAQQQAADKSETTPAPGAAQAAGPAAPAPAPDPELLAPQPAGEAGGQEMVAAAQTDQAGPANTVRDPDEPAADPVQAEALPGDAAAAPAPVPPASMGCETVPAAPEPLPGNLRSDVIPIPASAADAALADTASEAQPLEAGAGEKAGGGRDPAWPDAGVSVPDQSPPASPHATPPVAPNAIDAAALSAMQPHAPAHAAKADAGPADSTPAAAPPPAAQVAPAVAALVSTSAQDGVQRLVLRLSPVELGQVEVRVERAEGGPATIALTVERPETLLLLVRDQAGLQRALDQAGIPAEGRTVQFQLGQQAPGTPGQQPDLGAGGGWGGFGGHGARQGRGETSRGWRSLGESESDNARAWGRAGIDITA